MSSCCPPNSAPYLESTYTGVGTVSRTENLEFYEKCSPSESSSAVIIIPDIFGWSGGRTRNVADLISESGFHVIVPKLLVQ